MKVINFIGLDEARPISQEVWDLLAKQKEKTMYAVVRQNTGTKNFTVFHETRDLAIQEAARLTRKEKQGFYVLKVIGETYIEELPVGFRGLEGNNE